MSAPLPHHETTGAGPAVVLVHAGICDGGMWDPQWESLAGAHRLDHPDILAIADRLAGALPNATAARIPAAAHLPSLEQPAAFDAVVAPFLGAVAT